MHRLDPAVDDHRSGDWLGLFVAVVRLPLGDTVPPSQADEDPVGRTLRRLNVQEARARRSRNVGSNPRLDTEWRAALDRRRDIIAFAPNPLNAIQEVATQVDKDFSPRLNAEGKGRRDGRLVDGNALRGSLRSRARHPSKECEPSDAYKLLQP